MISSPTHCGPTPATDFGRMACECVSGGLAPSVLPVRSTLPWCDQMSISALFAKIWADISWKLYNEPILRKPKSASRALVHPKRVKNVHFLYFFADLFAEIRVEKDPFAGSLRICRILRILHVRHFDIAVRVNCFRHVFPCRSCPLLLLTLARNTSL